MTKEFYMWTFTSDLTHYVDIEVLFNLNFKKEYKKNEAAAMKNASSNIYSFSQASK